MWQDGDVYRRYSGSRHAAIEPGAVELATEGTEFTESDRGELSVAISLQTNRRSVIRSYGSNQVQLDFPAACADNEDTITPLSDCASATFSGDQPLRPGQPEQKVLPHLR